MERKRLVKKLICILMVMVLCSVLSACLPWKLYSDYVSSSGNGVPSIGNTIYLEIQTDSMYPTFEAGETIRLKKVEDPSTLRAGDIIAYWTVINGERVINTHRIVEIYDGGGYLIFATKGDNNTQMDALMVHESEVIGKYVG